MFEGREKTNHAEAGKGERGKLRRRIGMVHIRISPGIHRGLDHFLEIAMVVKVETYAADDECQQKERQHETAGGSVPESECDETGERHEAGVNDG